MLLNKTDLVSESDLDRIEARLKGINKIAPNLRCNQSKVSVDSVLNIRGFDLKRTLEMDPEFLNTDGEHQHDSSVSSLSIIQPGDVSMAEFQAWTQELLGTKGNDVYRMKGVVAVANSPKRWVFQAVHMIYNGEFEEDWGEDEKRESKLVFIGKNLEKDELRASFKACLDVYRQEKIKKLR